MISSNQ